MEGRDISEVLARKLAGVSDKSDERIIQKWLAESPMNKKIFQILSNNNKEDIPGFDKEKLLHRIKSGMDRPEPKMVQLPHSEGKNKAKKRWMAIAASIVFLLTVTLFVSNNPDQKSDINPVEELIVKNNPKGQKSTIFLKDGTKVILNSASEISYLESFSVDERKVSLKGEAYFIVSEDKNRPFRVVTDDIITEAVGTEFNINANDRDIKVSLTEGIVVVSNKLDSRKSALNPGQEITYIQLDRDFIIGEFDPYETTAWKTGILIFKDASFDEIKERLELWYGVNIKAESEKYSDWRITAEFNNKSLESVLRSLSFAKKIDFKIDKNEVEITN